MKTQTFYWLKYLIANWFAKFFPTQPVYILHFTRHRDTERFNVVLSIGLFGIHFTEVKAHYDYYPATCTYVRDTLDLIWKSFYGGSHELIYGGDESLSKYIKSLDEINGIKYYLISSPKIIKNNALV